MIRKWMALALTLCLLLSGCGGNGGASSAPEESSAPAAASEQTVASAAETAAEAGTEDSQAAAETGDMIPEELGQWAWAQLETHNEATYAIDYDMDMTVDIDLDGESTTQKTSSRIKQIDSETDGRISYASVQMNGAVSETWIGGGYVYLSDANGKYKAPVSDGDAQGEQNGAADLLEIDAENFGTLTAEKSDKGYTVTFGDPTLDTWMAFSDMLSTDDDGVTCTAFTLDGTVEMDETGALSKLDMELSVQVDIMGMTMSETVTLYQTVNNYDDAVTVHVPEDDADFRELSDISLPTAFINGFNTLLSQYGVSYQSELTIGISDGAVTDAFVEDNIINYVYDEDNGLSAVWEIDQTLNGEAIGQTTDTYAGGEGVQVIDGEENSYTYDDASMLSDVQNVIVSYADSFTYGSDYQLEQDGEYQKLTMTLDSEYVEFVVSTYLSALETDIDFDEASEIASEGTVSFWFDLNGMLVMQQFDGSCTLSYTGAEFTITVSDTGAVLAVNDGVTVNAGA